MTQRERQILNWIEENPLISQQELAEKAVQLLSDALNGAPQASRIYREPPRLRLRGSVSRRRPVLLSP